MPKPVQLGFIRIFLILFSIVVLGVAIYAVSQSTEFRQRASEGAILYLTASPRQATPGQKVELSLDVQTNEIPVTTARVNLSYPSDKLTFEKMDFNGSSFDMYGSNIHGFGYIQISRDASSPVNGKSHLATIHFTAQKEVNMDDIKPVNGTAIVNLENKNIYTNAVSREAPVQSSVFSIQFFFQLFQNLFK